MEKLSKLRQSCLSDSSRSTPVRCCHEKPLHKLETEKSAVEDPVTKISYVILNETSKARNSYLTEDTKCIAGVHRNISKRRKNITLFSATVLNKCYEPQNMNETKNTYVGLQQDEPEGNPWSCLTTSPVSKDSTKTSCTKMLLKPEHFGSSQHLLSNMCIDDSLGNYECAMCYELMLEPTTFQCDCNYSYCRSCIAKYYKECGSIKCPMCRRQWETVPPVNQVLKREIIERFDSVYRKRLTQQSASELESICYLESKDHHHPEKKDRVNSLPFPHDQLGNDRGIRLCLIFMAASMVIIILVVWFGIP